MLALGLCSCGGNNPTPSSSDSSLDPSSSQSSSQDVPQIDPEVVITPANEVNSTTLKTYDGPTLMQSSSEVGVKAAKRLEEAGVRTNLTLVFSSSQAIQAGRLGTKYVSPFVGWKESNGEGALAYMEQISNIYHEKGYKTEIIAAAIRTGKQIADAAEMGADIVTCGLAVFEESFTHPYTDLGLGRFQDAWDHTEGN